MSQELGPGFPDMRSGKLVHLHHSSCVLGLHSLEAGSGWPESNQAFLCGTWDPGPYLLGPVLKT